MRDENLIDEYVKKSLASIERCLDCTDQLILVAKLLENTLNSGKKILFSLSEEDIIRYEDIYGRD